jgi:hypothetical protein
MSPSLFDNTGIPTEELDVIAMLMLNWVLGELDGTMIVAPKDGRMLLLESKL